MKANWHRLVQNSRIRHELCKRSLSGGLRQALCRSLDNLLSDFFLLLGILSCHIKVDVDSDVVVDGGARDMASCWLCSTEMSVLVDLVGLSMRLNYFEHFLISCIEMLLLLIMRRCDSL